MPHIWIPRSEGSINIASEQIQDRRVYTYLPEESMVDIKDDVWWGLKVRWDLLPEGKTGDSTRQVLYIANPIPDVGWPFGDVFWEEWARLSVATSNKVLVFDPNDSLVRWLPEKDLQGRYLRIPYGLYP